MHAVLLMRLLVRASLNGALLAHLPHPVLGARYAVLVPPSQLPAVLMTSQIASILLAQSTGPSSQGTAQSLGPVHTGDSWAEPRQPERQTRSHRRCSGGMLMVRVMVGGWSRTVRGWSQRPGTDHDRTAPERQQKHAITTPHEHHPASTTINKSN